MSHKVATVIPSSAVATSGTLTFAYPTGTDASTFAPYGHRIIARGLQAKFTQDLGEISVAFGASTITVTYKGTTSIPADTVVLAEFNISGSETDEPVLPTNVYGMYVVKIDLGAPDVADADGISASQSVTSGVVALLNGAVGATLDVPRNVVGAWTNTAIATVTGRDVYGDVMIEQSASGTSLTGKKAFKTITSVVFNANVTGCTIGTGDVIGIPIFIPGTASVFRELQDGAAATAGTVVAGVQTTPTATTGDVRGTYDPNAAADGSKAFVLYAVVSDPEYKGVDNYDG